MYYFFFQKRETVQGGEGNIIQKIRYIFKENINSKSAEGEKICEPTTSVQNQNCTMFN